MGRMTVGGGWKRWEYGGLCAMGMVSVFNMVFLVLVVW